MTRGGGAAEFDVAQGQRQWDRRERDQHQDPECVHVGKERGLGLHLLTDPLHRLLLRLRAGLEGYGGGFIEHYLVGLLYPGGLTRELQLALAAGVVLVNLLLYARLFLRRPPRRVDAG